ARIGVRFGVMPGTYEEGVGGVPVGSVSAGGPAEAAGLLAGDLMTHWNGTELADVMQWMELLGQHQPGDRVQVTVQRAGESLVLWATLEGLQRTDG
ncbi:MAG TPA: PDZ domain-containing protein, partial [Planctomycetota bacterium]|nr:PDZ domain-containing protein [Planctomycetota bacterium]